MEKCKICGKETPIMQLGVRYCTKCKDSVIPVCMPCGVHPFYCTKCKPKKGWREDKDPDCIGKDGEPKARRHRDAKLRAEACKANNTLMLKTPEELPPYIQKHASIYQGGIKVVLPYGYLMMEEDARELPSAKKRLKSHGFQWNDRGYYWRSGDEQQVQKRVQTEKFKQDFSRFLSQLAKKNRYDTTISEFRRWLKEDLMEFERKSPREQVEEKLYYEKDIGNEGEVFESIKKFLESWLTKNTKEPKDSPVWYHGTTEDRYRRILADGKIKVSTAYTAQHKGFEHDIGTISLAKNKGQAHFFSAISGMGKQNQVILHIDTRKLDLSATKIRNLFAPDAEILYHKNIPVSAIVKAETVYIARKHEEQ